MIYFPLVGMLLGGLLIALNYFSSFLSLPLISVNIILVISLAVLTGGMHLDGLSDTIDGFASGKGREGILDVMKDPRIGAMGALGIFSILLLKLAFLHSIDMDFKAPALILMCGLSRWSLVFCSFLFPIPISWDLYRHFLTIIIYYCFIVATIPSILTVLYI